MALAGWEGREGGLGFHDDYTVFSVCWVAAEFLQVFSAVRQLTPQCLGAPGLETAVHLSLERIWLLLDEQLPTSTCRRAEPLHRDNGHLRTSPHLLSPGLCKTRGLEKHHWSMHLPALSMTCTARHLLLLHLPFPMWTNQRLLGLRTPNALQLESNLRRVSLANTLYHLTATLVRWACQVGCIVRVENPQ